MSRPDYRFRIGDWCDAGRVLGVSHKGGMRYLVQTENKNIIECTYGELRMGAQVTRHMEREARNGRS